MINPISTANGVVAPMIVFLVGLVVTLLIGRRLEVQYSHSAFLYLWHTLFCSIYVWFTLNDGGDAIFYYANSLRPDSTIRLGTSAVIFLTHILSYYLNLSYLGASLAFNIFGSVGMLTIFAVLQSIARRKIQFYRWLAWVIILMPSLSFWSSGIGKDSLAFLSVGLAIWANMKLKHRIGIMILAIIIMLTIRPHIAGIMLIALVGSLLVRRELSIQSRIGLLVLGTYGLTLLVPFVLDYSRVGSEVRYSDALEFISSWQNNYQQTTGAINLSSMSLPMKMFTYLFRPLPFEAQNLFQLSASLDNIILLFILTIGGNTIFQRQKKIRIETQLFPIFYVTATWLVLALTTANSGIAARQKWMFTPMMIVLLLSISERQWATLFDLAQSIRNIARQDKLMKYQPSKQEITREIRNIANS